MKLLLHGWKVIAPLLVTLPIAASLHWQALAQVDSQQILPISNLRTWLGRAGEPVSVRGVVTRTGRDSFVQDSTGGVLVHFQQQRRIKVGDELEVKGLPQATPYGALLEQATARVLWGSVPPPPIAITPGQAARGDFDDEYVEMEARLDKIQTLPDKLMVLSLSDEQQSFSAILQTASGAFIAPKLQLHAMVRLRGVCSMNPELTRNVVPFVLLMRSAEDAEQLAGPPWWTPQLLFRDFLILLSFLLCVALIFVRVRNVRLRAVQQEREDMAHEMHDTLAQSFAGVAFQLHAVRVGLPPGSVPMVGHLDTAIDMVRHSHQEARRSIAALKTRGIETPPIAEELMRSLERMVGEGPIRIHLLLTGVPRALPLRVANTLLRIGQEAGANAIHHSGGSTLTIRLLYLEGAVMLEIEDNGCGFDPDAVSLGFGLSGMSIRAQKLQGALRIITKEGSGTTISASVPLRQRSSWKYWTRWQ